MTAGFRVRCSEGRTPAGRVASIRSSFAEISVKLVVEILAMKKKPPLPGPFRPTRRWHPHAL
jgi:hypothetical protein